MAHLVPVNDKYTASNKLVEEVCRRSKACSNSLSERYRMLTHSLELVTFFSLLFCNSFSRDFSINFGSRWREWVRERERGGKSWEVSRRERKRRERGMNAYFEIYSLRKKIHVETLALILLFTPTFWMKVLKCHPMNVNIEFTQEDPLQGK